MRLEDGFGRTFKYLRLSVTEVCNFKCQYCLPNGYKACGEESALTVEQLRRAATAFSELGLSKIRLTGGEPTVRKDFSKIIEAIAAIPDVNTLALTTNGYRLEKRAKEWKNAGLNAVNISLDSLCQKKFQQITGHDRRDEIMRGIDAAFDAGFEKVKINAVYMKDINDEEVEAYIALTKNRQLSVRFIELMETGDHAAFFLKHHAPVDTIKEKLLRDGWTSKLKSQNSGPANDFVHPDFQGSFGLISPYSKDFCTSCNRLRFSSLGNLHLCLFGELGVPMRALLQSDDQLDELKERITNAVTRKKEKHLLANGATGMTSNLSAIGG